MPLTQLNRRAQISTPLKTDALVLRGLHAEEQLGQLFRFDLELLSEKPRIEAAEVLGKAMSIRLDCGQKRERFFHGMVSRFTQTTRFETFFRYQVTLVPNLWLLTRAADCRIFQNMTVPAIIEEVCKKSGVTIAEARFAGAHTPWEYCVQYRETDFHFISRLMEQEGIYYFFEHEEAAHNLILADSPGAHHPIPGYEEVSFRPRFSQHLAGQHVHDWAVEARFNPDFFVHTDYDFTKPRVDLRTQAQESTGNAQGVGEVFDYPGEYAEFNDGEEWAKVRMQSIEAGNVIAQGHTDAMGIRAGGKFTLTETPPEILGGEFLIISTAINLQINVFETGKGRDGDTFNCGVTAMDAAKIFRPARTTLKPLIRGVQTALVTGPAGEEIHTDKFGRIKVQFFWDRLGKQDENTTCFIRVGQVWAGKRWGATFIPRIGHEVIVAFLEGDPDQPIIVGSVYNGEQMPPYLGEGPDPKHKHDPKVSGIKTLSTKGGAGFNELRFDDNKGKEEVFLHAEKDLDTRVKNDSRETIGHDRLLTVGGTVNGAKVGDQFEMVMRDKHLKVHRHQEEHIGGNQKLLVGGIDGGPGHQDIHVRGIRKVMVDKDDHLYVEGKRTQEVAGATTLEVGGNQQEKVAGNHALDAGKEIHLKAGTKVIIEAGTQLTIKVGGNFIDIGPSGVTIVGTMVKINSGGAAGVGLGSTPGLVPRPDTAIPTLPALADDSKPGFISTAGLLPTPPLPPPPPPPPIPPPPPPAAEKIKGTPVAISPTSNSIVCRSNRLTVQNNNTGPDRSCTQAHEESHVKDWKERYGDDLCEGVADGSLPVGGDGYAEFLRKSECKGYQTGKACRENQLKTAAEADKPAIKNAIKRDDAQLKNNKCT